MMMQDCLIANGLILTMDGRHDPIENGAVLVRQGAVAAVGKTDDLESETVETRIDAKGKIVMPGLVNCHTHLPMSMFRGLADDLPLDVWLNEHIFPAEARQVNPESVEKWTELSCREILLSGTTTCCDGYFYEENVVRAALRTGIRLVAGQGVIDFPAPGVPDPGKNVETAIDFVNTFKDQSSLVFPSIFCHSAYTCSSETLVKAKKAAVQLDVLFQIHAAETRNEPDMINDLNGRSVIQYLDDIGVLDSRTLLVHSVWINEGDMDLIKKRGSGVAHCPESNMKLASGIAPVPDLIKRGVPVGLGTDSAASNNDQDLMSEMGTAAKLHKVATLDPCVMDAKATLEAATIGGARAIGLADIIGSIEPGKRADIVLVDLEKPHLTPMFDPYSALVYSARASDVSLVMVDGKILVENGALV